MTRKQGWQGPLMSLPYNWLVCKNLDYIPSYALLSNSIHCHFALTFVLTNSCILDNILSYAFLLFTASIHCFSPQNTQQIFYCISFCLIAADCYICIVVFTSKKLTNIVAMGHSAKVNFILQYTAIQCSAPKMLCTVGREGRTGQYQKL